MLGGGEQGFGGEVVEEDGPDFGAAGAVQGGEAEGDVHAGLEGLVEGADAVGCEEEDAVEVFEGAEEDCGGGGDMVSINLCCSSVLGGGVREGELT